MNQNDIIRIACWRYNHDLDMSSVDLAVAISTPAPIPTTMLNFYAAAVGHGASLAELAPLYKYSAFVTDFKAALTAGDSDIINALIAVAKDMTTISDTTMNAIGATMAGLRLIDAVAAEYPDDEITMPVTITAAMVDEALGRGVA